MNQLDHDGYERVLDDLRDACLASGDDPQVLIGQRVNQPDQMTLAAINYRTATSTTAEQQSALGYLSVNTFSSLPVPESISAWLICLDVGKRIKTRELELRFAPYQKEQALFQQFPKLLANARDAELLPRSECTTIYADGLVKFKRGYARLDLMLSPLIIVALEQTYQNVQLHIRIDPCYAEVQRAQSTLTEAVLEPAKYRWWKNLGLYRGEKSGSLYDLFSEALAPPEGPAYLGLPHSRFSASRDLRRPS
jgi:hypothetical protein